MPKKTKKKAEQSFGVTLTDAQCAALSAYLKNIEENDGIHAEYVNKKMLPDLIGALNVVCGGKRVAGDYADDE